MGEPYVTFQKLRFCDTDALGHVNNAVYSVMLEAGRAEMMMHTGLLDPKAGFAVVIARLELDFLREMAWPGDIRIESAMVRIADRSMHMRQLLHQGDTQVARARSVLAVIDTATRRAVPIAAPWRAVLEQWLVPVPE
jgi:acyl-CoA thioester hydrolase